MRKRIFIHTGASCFTYLPRLPSLSYLTYTSCSHMYIQALIKRKNAPRSFVDQSQETGMYKRHPHIHPPLIYTRSSSICILPPPLLMPHYNVLSKNKGFHIRNRDMVTYQLKLVYLRVIKFIAYGPYFKIYMILADFHLLFKSRLEIKELRLFCHCLFFLTL